MHKPSYALRLGAFLLALPAASPVHAQKAAAPAYTVTDLGTLGGASSTAAGLNDRGQVVGWSALPGGGSHAFLWDHVNGLQNLGAPSGGSSFAAAINSHGQIAGTDGTHPFFYDGAGMHDLPTLGGTTGGASGLNDAGQVVGQADTGVASAAYGPLYHAFVWDAAHGIRDISTFAAGDSTARGINSLGQIAGWQDTTAAPPRHEHAFLYAPLTGLSDLGTLPGGTFSDGVGINASAQVVASADTNTVSGAHGALFARGMVTDLGTLGGYYSQPFAINDRGLIVGWSEAGSGFGPQHAALFSSGVAVDLNSLIDSASGWTLTSANGLNNVGQIVGSGTLNGQTHGFLLTPVGQDQAVAYQINPAHTGAVSTPNFGPPLTRAWSVDLGMPVGYPLIAGGRVFVIAGGNASGSAPKSLNLYALNAATGAVLWGPVNVLGTYPWAAACYDGGRVFVVNSDGRLIAFDAGTGSALWNRALPGQYSFSAPPTARTGIVYVGGAGSGGTLYAVRETDGVVAWTAGVQNGDESSPAVTADGVYVSYAGPQAYKFDPITGALLWRHNSGIEGGGGKTPVLYNDSLYVRDYSASYPSSAFFGLVLDAATGATQRTFDPNALGPAPAFDLGRGFFTTKGAIQAQDAATGTALWTDTPGTSGAGYVTAPVVINGTVFEGDSAGNVDALDPATGSRLWTDNVGVAISGPDEQNVSTPLTGLAAGEGRLLVPAGTRLVAYAPVPPNPLPSLTGVAPAAISAGQGAFTLTLTGSGFTGATTAVWDGTALTTTFVSPTQLTAYVQAALTATPGTAQVTVTTPAPGGGTSAPVSVPVLALQAVYRLYNAATLDHFYTANPAEQRAVAAAGSYQYEGVVGYAPAATAPGAGPVFRLYNPRTGEHFYTQSAAERDAVNSALGYAYEGVAFGVFTAPSASALPLYRLYSASWGRHFYTTSQGEYGALVASGGWADEGVVGYLSTGP